MRRWWYSTGGVFFLSSTSSPLFTFLFHLPILDCQIAHQWSQDSLSTQLQRDPTSPSTPPRRYTSSSQPTRAGHLKRKKETSFDRNIFFSRRRRRRFLHLFHGWISLQIEKRGAERNDIWRPSSSGRDDQKLARQKESGPNNNSKKGGHSLNFIKSIGI